MNRDTSLSANRVWAVSSGAYSDYQVHCVCLTRADADAVATKMRDRKDVSYGYRDARVEELMVITGDVEPVTVYDLRCQVFDNGTTSDTEETTRQVWPFDSWEAAPPVRWRWVRAPVHNGRDGRLEVQGTDRERVRQVFSDRRAMLLADSDLRAKRERKGSDK